jgi:hypothetical protein
MNEDLLYTLRQQPDETFARTLRERLRRSDAALPVRRSWPLRRLAIAAAAIIVIGALSSVPGVRAYADSFLSLFRVVNFVAVPVSSRNAVTLTSEQLNLPRLLSEHVQVLQEPGDPVTVASPIAASGSVGFTVAQPSFVPDTIRLDRTTITGPRALRATIDAPRLNDILNALAITDLQIPAELDGQIIYVNASPVVRLEYRYQDGGPAATLMQALPPQVQMPRSLDLPRLGEIALRVLGMPGDDAHRLARTIDWTSTFLVPIPPDAASFRQIDIGGRTGILIEASQPRRRVLILWSTGDRVFALEGAARDVLQQMASSIP